MNGNEFDKLLSIQEKSIIAWDRAYNKLERLSDEVERLSYAIEKKIDTDEKFVRWLKTITAITIILAGIITTIVKVLQ